MATQFDIIRSQAEAAARNAATRAQSHLRRDASLVNQASRWAGRTLPQGEASLRRKVRSWRRGYEPARDTVAEERSRPVRPAPDGYVRRSPVQPMHVAPDYRRRQVRMVLTGAAVAAAAGLGIYLLGMLGIFGR